MDVIHDECLHLAIDFKLFVQEKHVAFFVSTCSLGELDEKTNYIKILNQKAIREIILFFAIWLIVYIH